MAAYGVENSKRGCKQVPASSNPLIIMVVGWLVRKNKRLIIKVHGLAHNVGNFLLVRHVVSYKLFIKFIMRCFGVNTFF